LKKIELIRAVKHRVWDWPVVFNLTAGGAAAGFYLLSFLINQSHNHMESQLHDNIFKLAAPVVVGLGFLFVAFETGKPSKAKYLLHNIHTSWLSREVFFGLSFICLTLIDFIFPNPMIKLLAGAMAIGLLFSQGLMIKRSCGIIAWNTPIMPFYFFFSGLYIGFGSLLIASVAIWARQSMLMLIVGFIIIIFDSALWIAYLKQSEEMSFQEATRIHRRPSTLVNATGIVHGLPATLLLVLILSNAMFATFKFVNILSILVGAVVICNAIHRNSTILLKANYFKELFI
jgi:DMSO reductase anchor subunit